MKSTKISGVGLFLYVARSQDEASLNRGNDHLSFAKITEWSSRPTSHVHSRHACCLCVMCFRTSQCPRLRPSSTLVRHSLFAAPSASSGLQRVQPVRNLCPLTESRLSAGTGGARSARRRFWCFLSWRAELRALRRPKVSSLGGPGKKGAFVVREVIMFR